MSEPAPAVRTVLFTLVDGSTALRTRAGEDAVDAALAAYEDVVREAVEHHGGQGMVAFGEGYATTFVTPRAAVDCAVAIQRAMDAYADEGLRVRVGVHHGPVESGPAGFGSIGEGVEGAAAVVTAARGRQILVSEEVRREAGTMPGIQFVDRGAFKLSDEGEPTGVAEVVWSIRRARSASPIQRQASPFVGRDAERDQLRAFLDAALGGHGSLVLITGDAGVGKSRLADEVAEEASRRGFLALTGRCADLADPPAFMPLLEILRTAMSVVPPQVFRESLGEAASWVARLLPELGDGEDAGEPPGALDESLLGRVVEACRDFLERTSRRRPTLLILDHLQWADEASVRLIRHTTDRLGELPAVIVGIYREDALDGRPLGAALTDLLTRPVVHRIALRRAVPGAAS